MGVHVKPLRKVKLMDIVVLAESLDPAAQAIIEEAGYEVVTPSTDDLFDAVATASALIVRSATRVDGKLMDLAPRLRFVGRAGVGLDNVDIDEATRRGIVVFNTPSANVVSAAEHTMALLLALVRRIPAADAALRSGRWDRSSFGGVELAQKTLGLVGLGRVGALVARRAQAFEMEVVAHDRFVSDERAAALGVTLVSLEKLLEVADVVSLHLPLTPETTNLVDSQFLRQMKHTSFLVNTSRGGVIDEAALSAALEEGEIAGAALDVFQDEPTIDSPLFRSAHSVVTPHLGASTGEAQERAATNVARDVVDALSGKVIPHAANLSLGALTPIVQAGMDVVLELARVLGVVAQGSMTEVSLEIVGPLADHETDALGLAAMCGLLRATTDGLVSIVSAPALARERGWTLTRSMRIGPGPSRITISSGRHNVAGEVNGASTRLVQVDGYRLDLPLAFPLLLVRHHDVPGMVGAIGAAFGDAKVNIDNLHVGRGADGEALTALTTPVALDDAILDRLASAAGIRGLRFVP